MIFSLFFACASHHLEPADSLSNNCPAPVVSAPGSVENPGTIEQLLKTPFMTQPISEGKTGVLVLDDGAGALAARAWLSENAVKSIDLQYFIFSADNVGIIATDALLLAAERGVTVRMLVDDLLAHGDADLLHALNEHPNIQVRIYNPSINVGKSLSDKLVNVSTRFRDVNQRMHNKTFIVDGNVVITGGRNVGDEYYDFDSVYNFRDRDVLLIDGTAREIQKSFNEYWKTELAVDIAELLPEQSQEHTQAMWNGLHNHSCDPNNYHPPFRQRVNRVPETFKNLTLEKKLLWVSDVSFFVDDPGKNTNDDLGGGGITTEELIKMVQQAKSRLWIQTPYLVVTDLGLSVFSEAERRGVDVKILTNSLAATDNFAAFAGYQKVRQPLLDVGVEIYEMRPDSVAAKKLVTSGIHEKQDALIGLHAKSLIIDDDLTMIGTFNLDPRSANLNTECIVVIRDNTLNTMLAKQFTNEMNEDSAWPASKNPDQHAPLGSKIKTFFSRLVPASVL